MNQIFIELVKQKTKTNRDNGKRYNNIETNEDEINKIKKEIRKIKTAIRNRKIKNEKYDDLFLRITELKTSMNQYESGILVLRDRITEYDGLRDNIKLKIKSLKRKIKNMKHNRVRCDNCEIDLLRASYSRHLKCKKP